MAAIDHYQVSKISLKDVASAIEASGPGVTPVNVTATKVKSLLCTAMVAY